MFQMLDKTTSVFWITLPECPSNKPGQTTKLMRSEVHSLGIASRVTWWWAELKREGAFKDQLPSTLYGIV